MRSPTVRGRVLSVCLSATALVGSTACGGGAPVAPLAAPEPAMAPLDSSPARRPKVKPRTRPQPPTVHAQKAAPRPAPGPRDSAALERAVTSEHAHWPLAVALARRS